MALDSKALSERLTRIEADVTAIRQALDESRRSEGNQENNMAQILSAFRTDKALVRQSMGRFFDDLGIQGDPIDPQILQTRMEQEGLKANELSQDLVKAREA